MKQLVHFALAALLALVIGGTASALPIATMTFTNPVGTVFTTDSIPVVITLSLQPGTGGLATDASGNVVGLTAADIDPFLFPGLPPGVDGNSATSSDVNVFIGCSGTFSPTCVGPPYDINFNFTPPTLIFPVNLNLADGSSTNFLTLTFTPTGGAAPVGQYVFTDVGVIIQVFDDNLTDPNDPTSPLHIADIPLASTLDTDPNASFTRDVTATAAVPEPGTTALIMAGLALVAGLKRRIT